ncbi:MAG: RNA polymerase sigma factor [Ectothiorhodospiraceae bacterium]|nr:RNA polymerase sigma factor [Ectothiorhodospiraceae bacterium]
MATPSLPSDEILIPKLLARDELAYNQIVSAYHGLMVHLARAIVGSAIADEVAQESWVAVLRALPKFERRSSLKTWILRIVSNTAKSRLRHESRTVNLGDALEDSPIVDPSRFKANAHWATPPMNWHADTPDALLSRTELSECISSTLSLLPPVQRAAITLRDMQGLSMEDICKVLEVSESNGRVLLHRARSRIQQAIEEHLKR